MKKTFIITCFLLLIIAGCATQQPLYYWGNYSQTLYNYKKVPKDENLRAHKASLVKIIEESNKRNIKVPPGICCEYAYILYREGNTQQASNYFQLEEKNYPESKVFVTRLKNFLTKGKGE